MSWKFSSSMSISSVFSSSLSGSYTKPEVPCLPLWWVFCVSWQSLATVMYKWREGKKGMDWLWIDVSMLCLRCKCLAQERGFRWLFVTCVWHVGLSSRQGEIQITLKLRWISVVSLCIFIFMFKYFCLLLCGKKGWNTVKEKFF